MRLRAALPVRPALTQPSTTTAVPVEFDEDGRIWVFRYSRTVPQSARIDRDRIFQYMKTHRLPGETERQIRRDMRNAADFFTGVRELQTHSEIQFVEGSE
ncbi:MAG TPA: hypothetical protein VGZ02_00455 [Candidatus Baltobacteraceae bacterium]|nr:hypothetical protein [Candidatus Baltobacteraceae bacterium]